MAARNGRPSFPAKWSKKASRRVHGRALLALNTPAGRRPALLNTSASLGPCTIGLLACRGEQSSAALRAPRGALHRRVLAPCGVGLRPTKAGSARLWSLAIFLALQERKCSNRPFRLCRIRRAPEAKPEKVELALDLAGWKPALLDGGLCVPVRRACGLACGLPVLEAQGNSQTPRAGSARLCRPEAYTTTASK